MLASLSFELYLAFLVAASSDMQYHHFLAKRRITLVCLRSASLLGLETSNDSLQLTSLSCCSTVSDGDDIPQAGRPHPIRPGNS
ncbi:hypothetical protein FKP32DRAFT_845798 [Trametes sanguinea]|nr:hypothetical protein FKP32DRAFT_845798 [Trametes sanguinea]